MINKYQEFSEQHNVQILLSDENKSEETFSQCNTTMNYTEMIEEESDDDLWSSDTSEGEQ